MPDIYSYVSGHFQKSGGRAVSLINPTTEEEVATAHCDGVDLVAALKFARQDGVQALSKMTFPERADLLDRMVGVIRDHRDELLQSSVDNSGSTRGGAKFDVDGAAAVLAAYADIGRTLGETPHLADGDGEAIGHGARLLGRHLFVPKGGVAVLINAFNFPAWGFAEKAATAILAGMPVVSKPGTATSWTAGLLTEKFIDANVFPEGVFTQVLGSITGMLENLGPLDLVAFTGSSGTGIKVRSLGSLLKNSVRVNVEADSLNAAVLEGNIDYDSPAYSLFIRDVAREMTEKSGQKCTATRRIMVAEPHIERVVEDLVDRLSRTKIGDPQNGDVTMGPLSTAQQRDDVYAGYDRLSGCCERVYGTNRPENLIDVAEGKGFFAGPSVFIARDEKAVEEVHKDEVFGPAICILPYDGTAAEAVRLVRLGQGMLVSSVYGDNREFLKETVMGIAPYCGRVVVVDKKAEGASLPTGMVLPQLNHGGPGRAGGGAELGGVSGIEHYMHRTALQGSRGIIERIIS